MKTLSGSPLSQPEGLRPRASSYRMIDRQPTQSHSRRQSTMSLPLELETTEPTEDDHSTIPPPLHPLSNSQEMNLTRMQSLSDADLVCSEATNDLDLLLNCDSSHTAVSASNHSTDLSEDTIPLFEHFLVIGASVDVSLFPSLSLPRLSGSLRHQSISRMRSLTNKLVLREEDYEAHWISFLVEGTVLTRIKTLMKSRLLL
jgi:hypothetical protein